MGLPRAGSVLLLNPRRAYQRPGAPTVSLVPISREGSTLLLRCSPKCGRSALAGVEACPGCKTDLQNIRYHGKPRASLLNLPLAIPTGNPTLIKYLAKAWDRCSLYGGKSRGRLPLVSAAC